DQVLVALMAIIKKLVKKVFHLCLYPYWWSPVYFFLTVWHSAIRIRNNKNAMILAFLTAKVSTSQRVGYRIVRLLVTAGARLRRNRKGVSSGDLRHVFAKTPYLTRSVAG